MHLRLAVYLALGFFLWSSAGHAEAGDTEARRKVYEQGRAAMAADRWEEGYRLFSGLWQERPSYDVAINLGEIELHLGKFRDAAEHLTFGLRHVPPREKLEVARTAQEGLDLAKQRVGTLKISVEGAQTELRVDGVVVGSSPLDHEVFVDPGSHQVEADSTGSGSVIRVVAIGAGQARTVELKFGAARGGAAPGEAGSAIGSTPTTAQAPVANAAAGTTTVPPSGPPQDTSNVKAPNYVPVILTGAATAAGVGLGIAFLAAAKSDDAERRSALARLPGPGSCGAGNPSVRECSSISDLADSAATMRAVSYVSFGVAAAAALGTFFLWPRPPKSAHPAWRVVPTTSLAAHRVDVGLHGVF
jgi:hypothetical protein